MHHSGDELYLLLHSLTQVLNFLLRPVPDLEAVKPKPDLPVRLAALHPTDAGQVAKLLGDLHLPIESTLLRQVAYAADMGGLQHLTIEQDGA